MSALLPDGRKSLEPWLKDSVKFYPYQIEGVRRLANLKSWILADEMGLGKSLEAIAIFCIDIQRGLAETCLVVCPVSIKENWEDEFEKFSTVPTVRLSNQDSVTERRKTIEKFKADVGPRVLIVNYEQVISHLDDLNARPPGEVHAFDIAIFDEAHYIKNNRSARTKAALDLSARRNFMLTGTPMLNNVTELWPLLNKINPMKWNNYWRFTNRHCNTLDAPIWMADGSFKPLGDIKVGDKVMGWERNEKNRRFYKVSEVLEIRKRVAPEVVRVTLESGRVIKCTPDHQWLAASHGMTAGDTWVQVVGTPGAGRGGKGGRRNGKALSFVIEPTPRLSPELQRQADWLAGLWDGEGSGDWISQSPSHNPAIFKRIGEVLDNLGIPYRVGAMGYQIAGGRQSYINLLNWFSPNFQKKKYFLRRVLEGNQKLTDGTRSRGQMNRIADKIVKVESLGIEVVGSMQTTTGNYIAWGYASKNCVYGGYRDKQIIGVKNEIELQNILNELMLRRYSKDVLPLKPPIPIIRTVTLTRQQRELYNQVRDELFLMDLESGEEQDINNALTRFLRLKQICGTTITFTGEDHSAKFERALVDNIQIYEQGSKAIVFSQFRGTMSAYKARLEAEGIPVWEVNGSVKPADRIGVVKDWTNDPRPGVIICGLQVAGIGLNMTAARYVLFLDKLYVPGLNDQAIARANRIGQDITKAVVVVYYLAKDTIESRIETILNSKQKVVTTIIDMDFSWKRNFLKMLKENA